MERPRRLSVRPDAQARAVALMFTAAASITVVARLLGPGLERDRGGLLWAAVALFLLLAGWVWWRGGITRRAAPVLLVLALAGGNALVACIVDPQLRTAATAWNIMTPMFLSASLGRRALLWGVVAAGACAAVTIALVPGDPLIVVLRAVTVVLLVVLPLVHLLGLRGELERAVSVARGHARTDALTGLLNRRGLQDAFERRAEAAAASGRTLAVMSFDLDHFKRINDTAGHAAGDAVLVVTARSLTQGLRADGTVVRLGGEELCAVVPVLDAPEARAVAERLRAGVARDGAAWALTTSVGVALLARPSAALAAEGPPQLLARLLAEADAALYRAKAAGRDRVEGPQAAPTTVVTPPYATVGSGDDPGP